MIELFESFSGFRNEGVVLVKINRLMCFTYFRRIRGLLGKVRFWVDVLGGFIEGGFISFVFECGF